MKTDGTHIGHLAMPLKIAGKEKLTDFKAVYDWLAQLERSTHVFLERAVSFGLGTKSAFDYGRSFEAIVIALEQLELTVTYVEPAKWTKEMHEGIHTDLKGKAKSLIAAKRLYPHLVGLLPTKPKGGVHDGFIDALLIAGYGLRKVRGAVKPEVEPDFR